MSTETLKNITFTVTYSVEDEEFVATCDTEPSLSVLDKHPVGALDGLVCIMQATDDEAAAEAEALEDTQDIPGEITKMIEDMGR